MVDSKTFVQKLNKALAYEYAATIQYVQHAAVITGAQYDAIKKELVVHAGEELQHAILVSEIINDVDGIPTVDVAKINISENALTMLEQDLEGEQTAIDDYKELISMATELNEPGIRQTLEKILIEEEEHKRDLLGALGR